MNNLSMNTGNRNGSNDVISPPLDDQSYCFEEQNNILCTPTKRKNRFMEDEMALNGAALVENSGNSCKKSIKSSISPSDLGTKETRKISSKLSPFSKYCSKLSPLCKKDYDLSHQRRMMNISKFSVDYMKTPTIERIYGEGDTSWLRNQTPEKIDFNLSEIDEIHNTPTFNSNLSDKQEEVLLPIKDKENDMCQSNLAVSNEFLHQSISVRKVGELNLIESKTVQKNGRNKI